MAFKLTSKTTKKSGAQLVGLTDFQRKIKNLARVAPKAFGDALYEEMEIEKKESMKRTPVDTGDLRDSHEVYGPFIRKGEISVEIRVGGGRVDYAIVVHERTDIFHRTGQAKFLESTLRESAQYILRRVARRVSLENLVK